MGWQDAPEVTAQPAWMAAPEVKPSKKGTATAGERVFQGAIQDPVDAGVQILANVLPKPVLDAGNRFNNWLADKTGLVAKVPEGGLDEMVRSGQRAYEEKAPEGVDWLRLGGAVASPVNLVPGMALAGKPVTLMRGAAVAAPAAMLSAPVVEGDFVEGKARQAGTGAIGGAVGTGVSNALARVAIPKAAQNANLALLRQEGVEPTIGQTLGGRWNALEEKLQSLPIVGDVIANARTRSLNQFNQAAVNRAVAPIGEKVAGKGQAAVKEAGDLLSNAYDDALGQVKFVQFDPQFSNDLAQLKAMAANLTPEMQKKFDKIMNDNLSGRMSPNGSMMGDVYKKVDSELGQLASRWQKSQMASEAEFGDAVAQLQSLLNQQMRRSNPQIADRLAKIDEGWANLVRIEGAAKAGKNAEGVFTPAQLNNATQAADDSVRKRAVARGTALMQDLGNAGQQVLGNKVPNSFTTDRALIAGGAAGAGALLSPEVLGVALAGSAAYTPAGQNALRALVASRPQIANDLAKLIRKTTPYSVVPSGAVAVQASK